MAPEVLKSSEYSDKSEIWALMSFLIEILTGKVMILHFFLAGNASIVVVQSKIDSLTEPPIPAVFKTDKSRSGLLLLQILRRGLAIAPKERLTFPELEALLLELLTIL
jgi:serine/threonine protein kinase